MCSTMSLFCQTFVWKRRLTLSPLEQKLVEDPCKLCGDSHDLHKVFCCCRPLFSPSQTAALHRKIKLHRLMLSNSQTIWIIKRCQKRFLTIYECMENLRMYDCMENKNKTICLLKTICVLWFVKRIKSVYTTVNSQSFANWSSALRLINSQQTGPIHTKK